MCALAPIILCTSEGFLFPCQRLFQYIYCACMPGEHLSGSLKQTEQTEPTTTVQSKREKWL